MSAQERLLSVVGRSVLDSVVAEVQPAACCTLALSMDARVIVCCADSGPFECSRNFLSTGRMGSSSLFWVED